MRTAESIDEDSRSGHMAWRIVPLLMLSWLFAYIDQVNIGFAKLQMSQELQFSDAVYGVGAGIFFLARSQQLCRKPPLRTEL